MGQEPGHPRENDRLMQFVNELHEQAVIHVGQVLDAKTTTVARLANSVPSDKAVSPIARVVPSPEECTTLSIKHLAHTFREQDGRHMIDR